MHSRAEISEIEQVVRDTLSADFASVRIVDVIVLDRSEEDGETLKIEVVFEGTSRDLDARSVSGAVRHVRPKLAAIGEYAFPLFSFVSKGDAGHLEPA